MSWKIEQSLKQNNFYENSSQNSYDQSNHMYLGDLIENQTQIIYSSENLGNNNIQIDKNQIKYNTLFKNDNTKVELTYMPNLNKLLIKKNHLLGKYHYKKETNIFELLKDKGITLDVIEYDEEQHSFKQMAGKYDLFTMRQKSQNTVVFEVFFLILLEKLNQLHNLGIAHADIKPQNILISYENEPFFIDFDSSVLLSDFKNYLKSFTYYFNLNIYVQKFINNDNNEAYKTKDFDNKEEIKLCDQTQLALTFLFLLCENQNQINLFEEKNYNELISMLKTSTNKNREIVISIISRILNQADSTINVIGDEEKQIFFIDHSKINEQLSVSNDITYFKNEYVYNVSRIDQFSIKVLYLLDSMGCNLKIIPYKMTIIPQVGMEQYNYICEKYNEIKDYQKELINYKELNQNHLNNLFYYLNVIKNQKCKFKLDEDNFNRVVTIIKKAKFLKTLVFKFRFQLNFIDEFLDILKYDLPGFQIEKLNYDKRNVECQIKKSNDTNIKKVKYNYDPIVKLSLSELRQVFNFIRKKIWTIQEFCITYHETLNSDQNEQIIQQIEEGAQQIMQLTEIQSQIFPIQIQQNLNVEINQNSLSYQEFLILYQLQDTETKYYEISEQSVHESDKNHIINNAFKLKEKEEEFMAYKILQNCEKIKTEIQYFKEFTFIFQQHNFDNILMWQEIKNNLLKHSNNLLKIILIDCLFSQNVVEIIKDILNQNLIVKCQYIQDKDYPKHKNFKNNMHINYKKTQSTEQRLNILFLKQKIDDSKKQQFEQQSSKKQNEIAEGDIQQINESNDIQQINLFFNQHQCSQLESIIIPKQAINKIYKIQHKNREAILQAENKEDINKIIEKIKNKDHYQYIKLIDNQFNTVFEFSQKLDQQIQCQKSIILKFMEKNNIFSLIQELFVQIDKSYDFFKCGNFNLEIQQDLKNEYLFCFLILKIDKQKKQIQFRILLKSDTKCDQITSILSDNLYKYLDEFQQQYNSLNQYIFRIQDLTIKFTIQEQIDDQSFEIIFKAIEKQFPHQKKLYDIPKSKITIKSLYSIYKIISTYNKQQIKFDFQNNQVEYLDLIKFISMILLFQPSHSFSFYIKIEDQKILKYILKQFENQLNLFLEDGYQVLQYIPRKSKTNSNFIFILILNPPYASLGHINTDNFDSCQ